MWIIMEFMISEGICDGGRGAGIIFNRRSFSILFMGLIDSLDTILWVIRRPVEALLVALLFVAFIAFVAPQF